MRKKRKRLINFLVLILVGIVIFVIIKLNSYSIENSTKAISGSNNEIVFSISESYRYVHIEFKNYNANSIKYSIINPKGEVLKIGEINKSDEFIGKGDKGEWKVVFDVNEDVSIDYRIWTGNIKNNDLIK